jgi:hypothetical protein
MKNLLGALILLVCATVHAAEWQWAIDTEGKKPGKAFLWIPRSVSMSAASSLVSG